MENNNRRTIGISNMSDIHSDLKMVSRAYGVDLHFRRTSRSRSRFVPKYLNQIANTMPNSCIVEMS